MSARCGFCDCGAFDATDGRTRADSGEAICWCGHTEMEHAEARASRTPSVKEDQE